MKAHDSVWVATSWGAVEQRTLRDVVRDSGEFFVTEVEAWEFMASVYEAQSKRLSIELDELKEKIDAARRAVQHYSPPAEVAP